ncbi:hypothetical protein BIFANG_03391 [Bifidobacterium angulatum DSM 20098 = JCM 7096]|uniref:Uncharacterized protein n=1 Tax=Bifidobacterium angulatum DSM 20098 = JCM 7096 TaxID=518635 RepID=C4FGC2_9BIFI|nr:hypothetical protein BIFANG_03391 [Bifidobacterium angulatum DSM 20098 = JCM 7096]
MLRRRARRNHRSWLRSVGQIQGATRGGASALACTAIAGNPGP